MTIFYFGIFATHIFEKEWIVLEILIVFIKICYGPSADVDHFEGKKARSQKEKL